MQVNAGNVLQVRAAFLAQQNALQAATTQARHDFSITPCGGDPVSDDYTPEFQRKLSAIVEVHERHVRELMEATDRLGEAALEYGYTEDEIGNSLAGFLER